VVLKRENAPQIKNTMTNKKIAQKNEHAEKKLTWKK
jgi:hypothetical protein